jgi:hypothetical protein
MGGRGRLREPRRRLRGGKHVARAPRQIREPVTVRCDAIWPEGRRVLDAIPPRKSSRQDVLRARTKTDTGGQVENTKVIEITLVKELGKMAP